ncbi:Isochorismatase [Labilithrix luteola]|uniref:Isochorismatase n=1 Tax=Labilithrix luteola TaxID=1391654 RepID=A0A0K1PKL5_9BACT|nr:cysteine hydrolase family protein [Labilithrix luteola]AKU93936.1 Isochorismatase [Labilithrix luteola]
MSKVLVVIDVQNDYFPEGKFPLWAADQALEKVERAMAQANERGIPVVLVQHVADTSAGPAPFFNPGTPGVELHPRIRAAAPSAPVVVKAFADAFVKTDLEAVLAELGATELLLTGMMTHNCVTHTAISKSAEKYDVTILPDCCTTVSEIMHKIALAAVATRVRLAPSNEVL